MGTISGGALFGKALAREGVEKAFILCGGHIMPILYAMRQEGIEIIDVRHEANAVYAAISYIKATGKPAVVVTTAGPGVVNSTPGMIEAMELGVPVLQVGGAIMVDARDAGSLQDMSTLNLMESCTKWARKVTSTARIPEYVTMALRQAFDMTPGPVYLEVPSDLLRGTLNENDVVWPEKARINNAIPFGDPALVAQAADLLAKAERPAAIIAEGARYTIGNHAADIAALSDYLKMPLGVSTLSCRGLFGDETKNPLLKVNASAMADVVLAMGCRFDYRLGRGLALKPDAKIIQVHTDMRQIGYNVRVDVGIVGGTGPVASQLLAALKNKRKPAAASWIGASLKTGLAALPGEFRSDKIPTHPARVAGEVARFLSEEGRDWNVVVDGGEAAVWMKIANTAYRPHQLFGESAIGMIGAGAGNVIGAWSVNKKPVLWYTGDGSFGFYAMEMDTMARLGIPVVCVISNDSAWGMIRMEQQYTWAKEVEERGQCHTELCEMRAYDKMPSMWDGYGEMVTKPENIVPAIKRAAANGKPSIVNVEVDHESLSPYIAGVKNLTNVYYLQK